MQELAKPGRDPRKEFEAYSFTDGINDISDLATGMRLPGVVTNVTAFGAFVDIGVHQDGLVHISQLSDTYVSDPHKAIKVNQKVNVTVLEIDAARKRISLSMKQNPEIGKKPAAEKKPIDRAPQKSKGKPAGKEKKAPEKNLRQAYSPFAELGKTLKNGKK
jgi:uncharacterized protein